MAIIIGTIDNDIIASPTSDNNIDGGAGVNEVQYQGSEYDYIVSRQTDGSVTVTAIVGTPYETDGTDTLTNIHTIRFLDGNTTRIIDDVANVESSTNQVIDFGESVTGQIYQGDNDYYQLQGGDANQAVHVVFSAGSSSYFNTDGLSLNGYSEYPDYLGSFTLDASGNQTLYISNTNLSLNDVRSYNYTVMRDLTGATDGADTLATGATAEYVDAGAGDDTITGSDRSEYIIGGTGTDIINAGKGDDVILGDDAKDTNNNQSIYSKDSEQDDHDVAIFSGKFSDYIINNSSSNEDYYIDGNWWSVTGADGTDYVNGIEILRFDDLDYIIDDYDTFEGADAAGRPSYAVMGDQIEGRLSYGYDEDWIAFDFGRNVVNKDTTLKLTLDFTPTSGTLYKEFYIVNATGFKLQFTDLSDDTTKQKIDLSSSNGTFEYKLQGIQWGENAEGGNFGGGQAFLVVDSNERYAYPPQIFYTNPDAGNYTISINRYREGTAGDDVLSTSGATEQERVEGIAGLAGDDTLTGSDYAESFDGGAGDDTINAGGGDDIIEGGAGDDTLSGEAGDDTFVASGTITDTMDGGSGTDTLHLSGDADLSGASFTSVEQLSGRGETRVSNVGDKLDSFDSASGVIFSGNTQNLQTLNGNYTLEGTSGNDTLKAGDGDNEIRPFAGINTIDAGAGDDTILWAKNLGTTSSLNRYTASMLSSDRGDDFTYNIQGSYEGGDGSDTLHFRLNQDLRHDSYNDGNGNYHSSWYTDNEPSRQYHLDLSDAQISNFEVLKLTTASFTENGITGSYGPASITITTAQLADLGELSGAKFVVKGGGDIDLSSVNLTNGATLILSGNENFNITGTDGNDIITTYAGNDTIVTGTGNDTVSAGAGVDTINTGAGDDTIIISDTSTVLDSINGGIGADTLRITGNDIDLSSADLTGIEILQANSQSLALTQAQYDQYKDNLTGDADLVLKLTQASTSNVADLPAGFVGIRGSAGNDNLTGSDNDDILVGDAGNDILTGGAGDDRLVGGEGTDTLIGGAGNDTFSFDNINNLDGSIDGGSGTDTLNVIDGQDVTSVVITSVELLRGSGTITMSAEQFASFESISGVDVQISGAISEFSLANTQLQSGASVSLAPADDSIDATSGIIGSTDADRITGSTSADNIYGGSGNDIILGGGGNDTIVGGAGNDVLDGGAGDDIFIITEGDGFYSADQNSINGISGDNWFNQLLIVDSITGNAGDDKVVLEFTDNIDSKAIYFSENSLSSIETVDFDGSPYYFRMFVDASVWDSVDNWNLYTGNENWPNGSVRLSIIGNDNNLDLSGLESSFNTDRIWLEGEFYDVDLTNLTATINEFKIDKLSSFTGSSNNDTVIIRDDSFDFSGGAGNDRVTINYDWRGSISNELSGTFHGGDGSDTLAFYEAYNRTIDLTNLDFIDFENIDIDSLKNIRDILFKNEMHQRKTQILNYN